MRIWHRFVFAIQIMLERKRNFIISVGMLVCTLSLFMNICTDYYEQRYDWDSYSSCFSGDLDTIWRLNITDISEKAMVEGVAQKIIQAMQDEGITVGRYENQQARIPELYRNEDFREINRIRPMTELEAMIYGNDEGCAGILYTDEVVLKMITNRLPDDVKSLWTGEADPVPILVGCGYRDVIQIGDVLTIGQVPRKVIGYLPEGDIWPADSNPRFSYNQLIQLDYILMTPICETQPGAGTIGLNSIYFYVERGREAEVSSKIQRIARDLQITVNTESISDSMQQIYETETEVSESNLKLILFMAFICLVTTVSMTVINCMMRSRQIGIWYASGVLPSDVIWMIFIEQFLKIGFSAMIAYFVGMWGYYSSIYMMYYKSVSLKWLCLLGVGIWLISSLVPVVYVIRKQPVQLLETKE